MIKTNTQDKVPTSVCCSLTIYLQKLEVLLMLSRSIKQDTTNVKERQEALKGIPTGWSFPIEEEHKGCEYSITVPAVGRRLRGIRHASALPRRGWRTVEPRADCYRSGGCGHICVGTYESGD